MVFFSMALSLGIDIGTSTVKATLVDRKTEEVCKESVHPLGSNHLEVDISGARERKVEDILQALKSCMRELETTKMLHCVNCIGVCGQMHGCVLWNDCFKFDMEAFQEDTKQSSSCSNFVTWQDSRCTGAFLSSLPSSESLEPVSTGYGCATMFWLLRHQPESLARFTRAGTIMDLVVWGLCSCTGVPVVMSSQNAVSWGYYNSSKGNWEIELLKKSDFPVHLLPEVVDAPSQAGSLQIAWHGIPVGTVVGVATGDLQCSIFATKPSFSDAVLSMGSASQLAVIYQATPCDQPCKAVPVPLPSSIMRVPYFHGDSLFVAASLTGGNGFSNLIELLESWMKELNIHPPERNILYDKLIGLAKGKLDTMLEIGVTLWGERHDPALTGSVKNITTDNASLGSVSAATMRGIVENLSAMMPEHILQHFEIDRILGSGSVLQRNPVLRYYTEDIFNRPLEVRLKSDAPMGAALSVMTIT